MRKLILFDFDGVIVDSYELSYEVSRPAFDALTHEQYKSFFYGNIFTKTPQLSESSRSAITANYVKQIYDRQIFPGMVEAIRELCGGYDLAIVSSTHSDIIDSYLEKHGLRSCFSRVLGADVSTSKVQKNERLLKEFDVPSTSAVFITDTLGDIYEAKESALHTIGVTWGFHSATELSIGNPCALAGSPSLLKDAIDKIVLL